MLPALAGHADVQVAAVASRTGTRAERFAARFECEAVVGYESLLQREDLDAVYVGLPNALHSRWAGMALAAGLHVLCEKPVSASHSEAEALARHASERGLVLMENFAFVHHVQTMSMVGHIAKGAVGQVQSIDATFGIPARAAGDVRMRPELGGGAVRDLAPYPIRAARLVLGDALNLDGVSRHLDPDHKVDARGSVLLSSDGGGEARCSFGFGYSYRNSLTVWGDGGQLLLEPAFTSRQDQPVTLSWSDDTSAWSNSATDDAFSNLVTTFAQTVQTAHEADAHRRDIVVQADLLERVCRWPA